MTDFEALSMRQALDAHDAVVRGDVDALRRLLGDPDGFPNATLPPCDDPCLAYAIHHGPLSFIRRLLDLGADPNYADNEGFPSLLAALSAQRADRHDVLRLLLERGADVAQRGVNDYTPLHYAVSLDDAAAIELLLDAGADPAARTRIDDYATPLEEAELLGRTNVARVLRERRAR